MSDWTSRWFFFLVIGFLIFTVSGGYDKKWKAVFTKSSAGSATNPFAGLSNAPATTGGILPNAQPGINAAPGLGF